MSWNVSYESGRAYTVGGLFLIKLTWECFSKKLEKRFKNKYPFICVYMFGVLYNALTISEVNDSQRPMC